MKKTLCLLVFLSFVPAPPVQAGTMDDLLKGFGLGKGTGPGETAAPGDADIVAGLKEAPSIGTGNAVVATSKTDGYYGNEAIRILMPKNMRKAADILGGEVSHPLPTRRNSAPAAR